MLAKVGGRAGVPPGDKLTCCLKWALGVGGFTPRLGESSPAGKTARSVLVH